MQYFEEFLNFYKILISKLYVYVQGDLIFDKFIWQGWLQLFVFGLVLMFQIREIGSDVLLVYWKGRVDNLVRMIKDCVECVSYSKLFF